MKYSKTYDIIVRVSKMNGREEGAESTMTVEDQLALSEGVIADQGGRVGKILKALDQSGWTAVESAAYREAKARIAAGESHGVAVAYDDRLARNSRKVGRFYDDLEELDAEVLIAGMPGVDYRTANGRMMTGLMAVVADAQYQTYKARGERTVKRMLERKIPNSVPYGYRRNAGLDGKGEKTDRKLDGKALVPDGDRAKTVTLIFRLRARGAKWSEIADRLHGRGVKSPSGGEYWVSATLSAMIQNRTYLGEVVFGEVTVKGAHKPVVDPNTFAAAQSTVAVVRTGKMKAGIAGGLLRCGTCDMPLGVIQSGSTGVTSYACRRKSVGKRCTHPVHIDQARVDAHVDRRLRDVADGRAAVDLLKAKRHLDAARATVKAAEYDLEQFQLGTEGLPAAAIRTGMEARIATVQSARQAYDSLLVQVDDTAAFPTSGDAWDDLTLNDQRLAARAVIDRIVVTPFTGTAKAHSDVESRITVIWR